MLGSLHPPKYKNSNVENGFVTQRHRFRNNSSNAKDAKNRCEDNVNVFYLLALPILQHYTCHKTVKYGRVGVIHFNFFCPFLIPIQHCIYKKFQRKYLFVVRNFSYSLSRCIQSNYIIFKKKLRAKNKILKSMNSYGIFNTNQIIKLQISFKIFYGTEQLFSIKKLQPISSVILWKLCNLFFIRSYNPSELMFCLNI